MAILDPRSNLIGNLILRHNARREGARFNLTEEALAQFRKDAEELAKKREFMEAGVTAEEILRFKLSLFDDLYHEAREIFAAMTASPTPSSEG